MKPYSLYAERGADLWCIGAFATYADAVDACRTEGRRGRYAEVYDETIGSIVYSVDAEPVPGAVYEA